MLTLARRRVRFGPYMSHRGAGGKASVATAERHLLLGGFIEVTLWVLRDNERAVKFYQSIGFVLDVGHGKFLERGGKALREVRFRKPLGETPPAG